MSFKSKLSLPIARFITKRTQRRVADPVRAQHQVLKYLMLKAKRTQFGLNHDFKNISNHQGLIERVPLRDYEQLRPYIDKVVAGEPNILWPGKPLYLCKTSGTTSGAKFIPLTKELLTNQVNSARAALLAHIHHSGSADFVGGKMIFLQGSPELDESGAIPTGRLSGIVARHVPKYLLKNRMPTYATNTIEDWETKVDAIVEETKDADMRLISGIPSWVQMYFERLLERTGKATVREVFPNFSLFVHGGVNYAPYRSNMEHLIGAAIPSIETFPASEGFFAYQDGNDGEGLLLVVDNGIYYEFIPAEEVNEPTPRRLSIAEVELNVNYALVLHTAAGLFGYQIGDVVKFTSLKPARIKVVGRTKHFTSAFGEHVIAEEVEHALELAQAEHPCKVVEFTVAPQLKPTSGLPHHEWFIEFSQEPADLDGLRSAIDKNLQQQNPYYKDLLVGNVLQTLLLTPLRKGAFTDWMRARGKLGGQNKVPRLANDRAFANALTKYRQD